MYSAQGRGECHIKEGDLHGSTGRVLKREGGVPTDDPPHWSVGGERAPLPPMRPSPRPEPLWGGCLCHLRARAAVQLRGARQAWALAGSPAGEGSPFVASFPSPRCWGLVVGLARGVRAGPQRKPPHGPLERGRKGRTCNQGVRYLLLLPFRALTLGS